MARIKTARNVYLHPSLHADVKAMAEDLKVSVNCIIEDAIRDHVGAWRRGVINTREDLLMTETRRVER